MYRTQTSQIILIIILIGIIIMLVVITSSLKKIKKYIFFGLLLCCYLLFYIYINREEQINTAIYKGDKYSLYIDWYNSADYFEESRVIPTYFILKKNDKVYVKYIYKSIYQEGLKVIPPTNIEFEEDTIVMYTYTKPYRGIYIPVNKDSVTIADIKMKYENNWCNSSSLKYSITIYK